MGTPCILKLRTSCQIFTRLALYHLAVKAMAVSTSDLDRKKGLCLWMDKPIEIVQMTSHILGWIGCHNDDQLIISNLKHIIFFYTVFYTLSSRLVPGELIFSQDAG